MQDKRNVGLDLARALAVTMVFCSHAFRPLHALGSGVDLFFLLSGFLVGRIYLRSQQDAHMVSGYVYFVGILEGAMVPDDSAIPGRARTLRDFLSFHGRQWRDRSVSFVCTELLGNGRLPRVLEPLR